MTALAHDERQAIPVLGRASTAPSLGDRARMLTLFDATFDLPLSRLDLFERDYPCAPEVLRAWAHANGQTVEQSPYATRGGIEHVLTLRVSNRILICVFLTGGAS